MKLLAPVIVQQVVKKAEQQMNERFGTNNSDNFNQRQQRNEKPHEKKKVGEYIDYEELD